MVDPQSPADFPLLIKSLLRTPLQIARDVEIVSDGLARYSYADLEDRLRRLGAGLAAQGVKQGDVVAVEAVGDQEDDRALPQHAARPVAVEAVQALADPGAA